MHGMNSVSYASPPAQQLAGAMPKEHDSHGDRSRRPRSARRRWQYPAHRGYADSPRSVIARAMDSKALLNISAASTPAMHSSRTHHSHGIHPQHGGRRQHRRRNDKMRDEAASPADPFAEAAERIGEFLFPRTGHGRNLDLNPSDEGHSNFITSSCHPTLPILPQTPRPGPRALRAVWLSLPLLGTNRGSTVRLTPPVFRAGL